MLFQAGLYSRYNGLQRAGVKYLLDNYSQLIRWRGQDTILDVGCGPADVTTEILLPILPKDFKSITGADKSNDMLTYARKHQKVDDRFDYKHLDIATKELPKDMEGKFDHIFSFYCFQWVQDEIQAYGNLKDLLTPGGDMLLNFVLKHPSFEFFRHVSKNPKWSGYMQDFSGHCGRYREMKEPERELEKVVKQAGFSNPLCKVLQLSYTYPSLEVFRKSITAINPNISLIPEDLQDEYERAFEDAARAYGFVITDSLNENVVKFSYKTFMVYAKKED